MSAALPKPCVVALVPDSSEERAAPVRGGPWPAVVQVPFSLGQTIAGAVYLSGFFQPPALCSGLSRCGRCRMRFVDSPPEALPAERRYFTPEELASGWRLACRHKARAGLLLELPEGTLAFDAPYAMPGSKADHVGARSFQDAQGAEVALSPGSAPESGSASVCPSSFVSTFSETFTPANKSPLLAVDFGTTSVQWRLFIPELRNGVSSCSCATVSRPVEKVIWEGSAVNPLMGAGSDVISRLAAAEADGGGERLRLLVLESLQSLVHNARDRLAAEGYSDIAAICLAANPAMTCIGLGCDIRGIARAPYSLPLEGGEWHTLSSLPPVWIPPQISPFVGGDISAGYAFLALNPQHSGPRYPFLLADMGTNGEFLLALAPDKAYAASVALGPALEGTGLSQGTEARPGAVVAFTVSPQGIRACTMPYPDFFRDNSCAQQPCSDTPQKGPGAYEDGPGAAKKDSGSPEAFSEGAPDAFGKPPGSGRKVFRSCPGITGTGYISLVSLLLKCGVLDRDGRFNPQGGGLLRRFFTLAVTPDGEPELALPLGLRLPASDIEELLKVKAAFTLGTQRLLSEAGIRSGDLTTIYVAGALGLHVDKEALEELGFFPQGAGKRIEAVGNASLEGAAVLLRYPAGRHTLTRWAREVRSLELARDATFQMEFPAHMHFAWQAADK